MYVVRYCTKHEELARWHIIYFYQIFVVCTYIRKGRLIVVINNEQSHRKLNGNDRAYNIITMKKLHEIT